MLTVTENECTEMNRICINDERKCGVKFSKKRITVSCSKPKGHKGLHVACGNLAHNLAEWAGGIE